MRKYLTAVFVFGAMAVPLMAAGAGPADSTVPATFTKDVAPIFFNRCATCHRPGTVAPMSLLTYKDARPWAKSIKEKVVAREMPPWNADPHYGKFTNDPHLSDREVATIVRWADAGAPEEIPRIFRQRPK